MVEPVRHRQTKEAATDMFEPKAAAPHLDSTATTFIITHSPSRSNRGGLRFSGEGGAGDQVGQLTLRVTKCIRAARSTTTGNIASPWRYDAGACCTLDPESPRPLAILRYASS